jgi:hypothetical protein
MAEAAKQELARRSDALTDLALTLPIFLVYHLGVVFLPVRNAADPVSGRLAAFAAESPLGYTGLTIALGVAIVVVLVAFGRKHALDKKRFLLVALEGGLYALIMRTAGSYVVGELSLGAADVGTTAGNAVMALGAGFYEEVLFRVVIFGGGVVFLKAMMGKNLKTLLVILAWGLIEAAVFSGWHHVGAMAEAFELRAFVFRAVCGVVLTAVFALRGFAPAVWTHAIYDLWVML